MDVKLEQAWQGRSTPFVNVELRVGGVNGGRVDPVARNRLVTYMVGYGVRRFGMETKLTLRMDRHLIEVAKRHAEAHATSVSQMVASTFAALEALTTDAAADAHPEPSERLRALVGVLPDEVDPEKTYRAHIERKHA